MNSVTRNIFRITILFILLILTMMIFAIGSTIKAQSSVSGKVGVYGDPQTNDSEYRSVLRSITENTPDYRFILNVGGVVENGNSKSDWNN